MRYLEVIIPVKNEQDNVVELVKRIDQTLNQARIEYGIILIDDSSTDQTYKRALRLAKEYPLRVMRKKGKPGKAYSILEAAQASLSDNLAMIDGDLQYPPEAISEMFEKLDEFGVVVAKRKSYGGSKLRRISSRLFKLAFGKFLFGFDVDIQSGLKLFKKEIIDQLREEDISAWALDLPLLITAREMGHKITQVEINFQKRTKGESKINFGQASLEIFAHSLKHKFLAKKVYILPPSNSNSMINAGLAFNKNRFLTHTTLSPHKSAIRTVTLWQRLSLYLLLSLILVGFLLNSLLSVQVIIAILSFIYFVDVLFNFFLIFKSLHHPPEILINEQKLSSIKETELPIYSILCPLYKEGKVLPNFLEAISKIDWPKEKLDVILLLEEDDPETIEEAKAITLPSYVKIVIVPNTKPKTKPKACNYGLAYAKGEYLVVFDAEDIPDPWQLKKAYLGFKQVPNSVKCLQAKLNYHNPHQNLLTRLFTAEYSLWFDVILTGLQSIETTIPLGGTSNHFRTEELRQLEGWDPFNVTEDCDLGVRLFQKGFKTAIIDSTTLEEANSRLGNWVRQRSRWIKGYMQTYLVQMRNPYQLFSKQDVHGLIFQLVVGGKIAFMFINPFLWITTIAYFSLRSIVGPSIEAVYPPYVFYMAALSLVFGNFLFLYYYMIGCAKREQWGLIKYVYLVPFYWLMVSWAACIALYQLIFKPHYWEKTIHGLHLTNKQLDNFAKEISQIPDQIITSSVSEPKKNKLLSFLSKRKLLIDASMLVVASMVANVLNFVFNAYLGRSLSLEDFGELSLFTSFLYLSSVPLSAFSATITHKIAFLFGKYSKEESKGYLRYVANRSVIFAAILTLFWLISIPILQTFFNARSAFTFLVFTPVWLIGVTQANFSGYLKGTLSFGKLAFTVVAETIIKLALAVGFVNLGQSELVFLAIPLSLFVSMALAITFSLGDKSKPLPEAESAFNRPFFLVSVLNGLTNITFLTLDVILVKHFLNPTEAGEYGLLALVGKITFFLGSLLGPFMIPIVSKNEGAKKDSFNTFLLLFSITVITSLASFVFLGVLGDLTVPILFGSKTLPILSLLPIYVLAIVMFTIAQPIISFFQAKQNYVFTVVSFTVSILQVIMLSLFHQNLEEVVYVMLFVSLVNLVSMLVLFLLSSRLWVLGEAAKDFFGLFLSPFKKNIYKYSEFSKTNKRKILIFNWRDVKHKWAGGAETYLHELSKRWVKQGHQVTIFCGNDGNNPRNEVMNGMQIVRRGGFYTVYIWAFLYYIFKFRGLFDVIVDSANGVPFCTPIFSRKAKFLIIYHVHQEVFREHLLFPLSHIARFIESRFMPFLYKNHQIITISESSKQQILNAGLGREDQVVIVNPGVDEIEYFNIERFTKTRLPSFCYVGRLKPYKNIDIAIKAFKGILGSYPEANLAIAGYGESLTKLRKLVRKLAIEKNVSFLGKISEQRKRKLLAQSWAMIQPSMIEGWGITVIEANAARTTVIASDVNGLRDSILDGKTGILVKVKSVSEFEEAMFKIIKNENLRKSLSDEAYIWSQNFSWEKSSEDFFRLIEGSFEKKLSEYKSVILAESGVS